MTYRIFLLAVLVPQLTAAALVYVWAGAHARGARGAKMYVGVLSLVAVAYTMPWDRWLIHHGVWTYPPGSVLGTIGSVPIEEYLFMIGQTALVTLWALTVVRAPSRPLPRQAIPNPTAPNPARRRAICTAGWLAAAVAGGAVVGLGPHGGLYLSAIVAWYGPPLALQSAAGSDALRRGRRLRLMGLAPTVLLWASDALAIHAGAWQISPAHTLGVSAFGLPIEEAVFFLLTDLLVVNSVVLLADETVKARVAEWAGRLPAARLGRRGEVSET